VEQVSRLFLLPLILTGICGTGIPPVFAPINFDRNLWNRRPACFCSH
jgi:hypothetical protein